MYVVEQENSLMQLGTGDATLAALLLANNLVAKPIRDKISTFNRYNPDPESFRGIGRFTGLTTERKLNEAFTDLTKRANPNFDPAKQMYQTEIKPDYVNYPGAMSRNSNVTPETFNVKHNYGVDRSVYAHELGHVLGQNTPVARQINQIRKSLQVNPKLTEAIDKALDMVPGEAAQTLKPKLKPGALYKGAKYLAPALAAGMIEGDDDLSTSVAINLALASPVLADEAIASMNGLKIMKEAGDPASFKQRARMAAAFSSYLAAPLAAALGGNMVGNLMD